MSSFWFTMKGLHRKPSSQRRLTLADLAIAFFFISIFAFIAYIWMLKVFVLTPPAHNDGASKFAGHPFPGKGRRGAEPNLGPPSMDEYVKRFKNLIGEPRAKPLKRGPNYMHFHQGGAHRTRRKVDRNSVAKQMMHKRPMRCSNCTDFPFPPISDDIKSICRVSGKGVSKVVDLVVLIFSDPTEFDRRLALRHSWLQISSYNKGNVRYVFLVGQPVAAINHEKTRFQEEQRKYKDIFSMEFLENPAMQTYKTMLGLKWVMRFCRHARHVLKADDDVWVNVPQLLTWLNVQPIQPPFGLGGFCLSQEKPSRDPFSKYFIPKQYYPFEYYPPFCNGPGYVLTPQVARLVIRVSRDIPFFPLEDVYLGFCLQALNLQVRRMPGFSNTRLEPKQNTGFCPLYSRNIILTHGYTPQEIRAIWNLRNGRCRTASVKTQPARQAKPVLKQNVVVKGANQNPRK